MKLLIIPWGTPNWSPNSSNMQEILRNHSKTTRVLYLVPLWGLLGVKAIIHNQSLLSAVVGIKDRDLERDTAINIRTWLLHKGNNFDRIIFLAYANGNKFWSRGAAGTPMMKKVKIVRWISSSPSTVEKRVMRWVEKP